MDGAGLVLRLAVEAGEFVGALAGHVQSHTHVSRMLCQIGMGENYGPVRAESERGPCVLTHWKGGSQERSAL